MTNRRQQLKSACLRGDAGSVVRVLKRPSNGWRCIGGEEQGTCSVPLDPFADDGGDTLLHWVCTGEPLGLGGCLLVSLAGSHLRGQGQWPSRHQKRRAQLLAHLLLLQPRLALLAGCRNAAGQTPVHAAVQSDSLAVLALLLAALRQVLGLAQHEGQQQGQEDAQQPAAAASSAAALQLMLSVQDEAGLTPLELALQRRQWAAARLLAAAGRGGLPLSLPQLEACALVQRSLGMAGHEGSSSGSAFSQGGVSRDGEGGSSSWAHAPEALHLTARGSSVTDALGGLLSKLWDAFGATTVAAAGNRGEGTQLEWQLLQHQLQHAEVSNGGGSSSQAEQQGQQDAGAGPPPPLPVQLQLRPLSQADVLLLLQQAEQQVRNAAASACAAADTGAEPEAPTDGSGSTSAPAPTAASNVAIGVAPAMTPSSGPAGIDASKGLALQRCIVCYEDFPPGWLIVRLPCGHVTCDACWKGVLLAAIDEGDPRRAACPEPGCAAPLPCAAATRLLPPAQLQRFQQLQAQRYLTTHPQTMRCCPQPACGQMLHLPTRHRRAMHSVAKGDAAAPSAGEEEQKLPAEGEDVGHETDFEAAAVAAVARLGSEAGLDAECGACDHRFCWRCGEGAHEPASCAQMTRWEEELAALRQNAPSADREWLSSNTKRCPQCRAHIQKISGCNHLRCRQCGHHFCWVCGRAWDQHSAATGGYYHCAYQLGDNEELPEYSGIGGIGGGGAGGSLGGPLAWVAGVWNSVRQAAQQRQLQRHLHQYLRLTGGGPALRASAEHMQLLLSAAGMLGDAGSASQGLAIGAAAVIAGPELLGVTAADATRMSGREWSDLVTAAAASAVDAAAALLPSALVVPTAKAAAEAALTAAVAGPTLGGTGSSCNGGSISAGSTQPAAKEAAYLSEVAEGVAGARSLLQHSAVALYQLPSGPSKRHLQQLSASLQRRLDQLEPLLLALPEREGLPRRQTVSAQQGGRATGSSSRSINNSPAHAGITDWLLARLYGVEPPAAAAAGPEAPERQPALAAVSGEVLLQQLHFAAAVHQQRGRVKAVLRGLQADMRQMLAAARAGLYA